MNPARESGEGDLPMDTEGSQLSNGFRELYSDATLYDSFSSFHPISFRRVLPFKNDPVLDDPYLTFAEAAHLAEPNNMTRQALVDEYYRCGLLPEADAVSLKNVIDFFDGEFFELMGLVYANAGMYRCALRWYHERIKEFERQLPDSCSVDESVYASVGYCLYSLDLFAEAIAWSKSCIGPRLVADAVCEALITYEAQLAGGILQTIERCGSRTRYSVSTLELTNRREATLRLKDAIQVFAPFQEIYIDWVSQEAPGSAIQPCGYPFKAEFDASTLVRHKMNLIFATCAQADCLVEKGYKIEAKRLLREAALLERNANIVLERLAALEETA